jgi:hypothetical protein
MAQADMLKRVSVSWDEADDMGGSRNEDLGD